MIPPDKLRPHEMQMAAEWMRAKRDPMPRPTAGPTMDAWKARIPMDIEGTWPSQPHAMSNDEMLDLAANAVTPFAGSTKPILSASRTGIKALLDMDPSELASLTKAQFGKLRQSLPGELGFDPAVHGASYQEASAARKKLFEESQRRARLAEDMRKADAMSPHLFQESAPSGHDLSRSYGPGKRGRKY